MSIFVQSQHAMMNGGDINYWAESIDYFYGVSLFTCVYMNVSLSPSSDLLLTNASILSSLCPATSA